jgi:hypothetical protein
LNREKITGYKDKRLDEKDFFFNLTGWTRICRINDNFDSFLR